MTDQEIIFAIADMLGFERDFQPSEEQGWAAYIDAECVLIPNYVAILGRERALRFLEDLRAISPKEETR